LDRKGGGFYRSNNRSDEGEIKIVKSSKSISDKNKIKVNGNLPLINSIYNLNSNNRSNRNSSNSNNNKKFATPAKLKSSLEIGKVDNSSISTNKKASRAQSTSFKFYKNANSTLRKSSEVKREIGILNFNILNVNSVSKSGKKK